MLVRAFVDGELGHFLNAQAKAVDVGGRKAMRLTAGAIRKKIAGNVRRAFPGGGGTTLAKLVRSRISGKGADIEGTVFSRAAYGRSSLRPGGPIDWCSSTPRAPPSSRRAVVIWRSRPRMRP